MKERVSFELGSFFANAGIVGLCKMLEFDSNNKDKYEFLNDVLYIDKEYLLETDLTDLFIKTTIELEKENGKYPKIILNLEKIYDSLNEQDYTKELEKKLKEIFKTLEANSYVNTVLIREDKNVINEIFDLIKKAKKETKKEELLSLLKEIIDLLKDKDVYQNLFFREIVYRRINKFWDSVSFLNRNNVKKEMKPVHYETFEKPFKKFLESEKTGKVFCEECGCSIAVNEKIDYSFLKGTTADTNRKRNDFWNYKVNSWICPKCKFIFSLIPLGFSKYQQNYLFLNCNIKVDDLKKLNKEKYLILENDEKKQVNEILLEYVEKQDRVLSNIEVIVAGEYENRFKVNVINKETLSIIRDKIELFKLLSNCFPIKFNDNYYINFFTETIDNLISLRDNYGLIQTILMEHLKRKDYVLFYPALYILKIQIDFNKKKKGIDMNYNIDKMKWLGEELRNKIFEVKNNKDSSVLTSLVYRLLNAVKSNDSKSFQDIVIRTCISYGAPVPVLLMEVIKNHDNFQDYAYAYILGIESPEKEEKDNGKKDEEI